MKERFDSWPMVSLSALILLVSTLYLGFIPEQNDFHGIIVSGTIAFTAYAFLTFIQKPKIAIVFGLGLLIRALLIFSFPNLSDDIYRFVWDGYLTLNGMNPYGYLPTEIVDDLYNSHMDDLLKNMNSPEYYTIYPPFTQLIFYVANWFGPDVQTSSIVIKLFFITAEIFTFFGIVKILKALNKSENLAAIYFLNPLILVEGIGNLHFEIIMVSFLVWSIYFLFVKNNIAVGALFMTLSIAAKLLPLMFLPFFLFGLKGKTRIKFFSFGFVFLLLSFTPIIFGFDFANFASSIDLYFQKFEFNGGIYYILRYIGQLWSGYNLIHYIGPLMGVIAVLFIVKKAYSQKEYSLKEFIEFAFFSFCIYLFFATTIHPWYLSIPILLSVFVQWRFAVLWSFLILITYINYSYDPYFENLWAISLEYIFVFGFLYWENRKLKTH